MSTKLVWLDGMFGRLSSNYCQIQVLQQDRTNSSTANSLEIMVFSMLLIYSTVISVLNGGLHVRQSQYRVYSLAATKTCLNADMAVDMWIL